MLVVKLGGRGCRGYSKCFDLAEFSKRPLSSHYLDTFIISELILSLMSCTEKDVRGRTSERSSAYLTTIVFKESDEKL